MKRISLLFLLIVLVGCQDKPKVEQKREPIVTQPEVEPQTTVSINQYKVIDTGQMKFSIIFKTAFTNTKLINHYFFPKNEKNTKK